MPSSELSTHHRGPPYKPPDQSRGRVLPRLPIAGPPTHAGAASTPDDAAPDRARSPPPTMPPASPPSTASGSSAAVPRGFRSAEKSSRTRAALPAPSAVSSPPL